MKLYLKILIQHLLHKVPGQEIARQCLCEINTEAERRETTQAADKQGKERPDFPNLDVVMTLTG